MYSDIPISQPTSQTTLTNHDRPPSYESLYTMAPHDTIETNNVATERNMAASVNRQARVRYRGELNSNQIPRRTDQGESPPNNEALLSNRLENIGPASLHRGFIPLNRPGGAIPRQTSLNRQRSHELHLTTNNENRGVMPNETSRQQPALNDINEARSEQISEPSIETRSGRNTRPSLEAFSEIGTREVENSSDFRTTNTNSSAEHPSDNNEPMIRLTSQPSFIQLSADLLVTNEEGNHTNLSQPSHTTFTDGTLTHVTHTDQPPTVEAEGEVVRNIRIISPATDHSIEFPAPRLSTFMDHTPVGRTVSDNSEDGVYIDITRNTAHPSNSLPSGDPHIAVRYMGQSNSENSVQTQSSETHEQENNTNENAVQENFQETTRQETTRQETTQDHNSLNSVNSCASEQTTNYLRNGSTETASGNIDISIQDEEDPNGNVPRRGGESLSSENDVATNDADTNSVSSLEIVSI